MFAYFVNRSQSTNMNQISWVKMYIHEKLTVIHCCHRANSVGSFGFVWFSSSINTATTKPHNTRDASNEDTQLNRRNLRYVWVQNGGGGGGGEKEPRSYYTEEVSKSKSIKYWYFFSLPSLFFFQKEEKISFIPNSLTTTARESHPNEQTALFLHAIDDVNVQLSL